MIPLTLAEVATAVRGRLIGGADPDAVVTGSVEFDSRKVTPGGLFLALPGERVDGHDFAAGAVRDGAVAALVTRTVDTPAILIDDPLAALGRLATAVLRQLPDVTVIGITGSAGKTTTKDLVAALLRPLGPTVAPPGSFNNEIGHPYTVLQANSETRYLVLENSARGIGHIAELCRIAPPRIGAVLNIGSAHLGEFGSREVIAQAKGELIEAVDAAGVAILNADDALVAGMRSRTAARIVTFGTAPTDFQVDFEVDFEVDFRATDVRLDAAGRPAFTLHAGAQSMPVQLALVGAHQVSNALAALAIAVTAGRDPADAAAALGQITPASRWRMEVTRRPDGVTVINDAYNANPESMRAALQALRSMTADGRRWAVLGSMAELGEFAVAEHEKLGRAVAGLAIDRLVAVGAGAVGTHQGAIAEPGWKGESVHVPDMEAALQAVRTGVAPGDVVLVKASRSEGLERLAAQLVAEHVTQEGRR